MTDDQPPLRITITKHARARMEEMGVTDAEVESVLRYPVKVTASRKYPGADNHTGHRITVPAYGRRGKTRTVPTVLWASPEVFGFLYPDGERPPLPH